MYHEKQRWKSALHNAWAKIQNKKYGKSQKDNVELCDYTADKPDNCQLVSYADSTSGEKCRFYQLLSQQVYLYSGDKKAGRKASCLYVALHRLYQLPPISPGWEMNPQLSWEKRLRESDESVTCIH